MKYLLLTVFLTGCGLSNEFCLHNQDNFGMVCYDVFGYGYKQNELNKEFRSDIDSINNRLNILSNDVYTLTQQGNAHSNQIQESEVRIIELQNQLDSLSNTQSDDKALLLSSINMLNNSIIDAQNDINYNEALISMNTLDILNLQQSIGNLQVTVNNNTTVINNSIMVNEVLDPCFDHVSRIDEVFLRMSNGMIISSFSDNGSALTTRFSVIPPSDTIIYSTTDQTGCSFKLFATGPNANKICWGPGFNTCI